ncbi:FbpB family small basic protein [Bacillus coahuilensis]|nr:FbpB family small basic protein [Bacillus coahuilensis]
MRKPRKKSFADLVNENRQALLKDTDALLRIEERIDERYEIKRNVKQAE